MLSNDMLIFVFVYDARFADALFRNSRTIRTSKNSEQDEHSEHLLTEGYRSEWWTLAVVSHSSSEHSDLNEIINLIQVDMSRDGALTDLLQYYDPISMDIILPQN